jgi:predicted nucleic acid-binding Zn ribbon protein
MNQQTKKLANIWANRRAEDDHLGIVYTFSEKALEAFSEQIRSEHTQSVIQLCANTINNNLNEQQRQRKNKFEFVELIVIVIAMVVWAAWWYSFSH